MPFSKSCSPAEVLRLRKKPTATHETVIKARNGSSVDFTSKVSSGGTDPMLHLKFAVDCPLPPGLVHDSTPISSKFNPEVYRFYKVPDPFQSPEDRIRQFQRASLSPRIKSDLTAKKMQVYVAVRLRPYTINEKIDPRNREACIFLDKKNNTVRVNNNSTTFQFDSLFDSPSGEASSISQERVYQTVGAPLVGHALNGYNSCLFAYGQTGSGKTHSIAGDNDCKGIIPRLVEDLFNQVPADSCVSFTYIEIYNDNIQNLLADSTTEMQNISYKIREHSVDGPYIPKLVPIVVENPHDLLSRWSMGNLRRQTAATTCNARSSRSHALLQITVQQKYFDDTEVTEDDCLSQISDGERLTSKINIVDLAGSERSNVSLGGDRLREGGYINKSLFTLGKVITELAHRGQFTKTHIPYRDSPLTFLLKESLGGNSRTFMLATISPSVDCIDETLSTLRYAAKAKRIVNNVRVNDDPKLVRNRLLEAEITRLLNILAIHKIDPNPSLPGNSTCSSLQSNSSTELPAMQSPATSHFNSPPQPETLLQDQATSPLKAEVQTEGSEQIVRVSTSSTAHICEVKPYQSTLIEDMKKIVGDVLDIPTTYPKEVRDSTRTERGSGDSVFIHDAAPHAKDTDNWNATPSSDQIASNGQTDSWASPPKQSEPTTDSWDTPAPTTNAPEATTDSWDAAPPATETSQPSNDSWNTDPPPATSTDCSNKKEEKKCEKHKSQEKEKNKETDKTQPKVMEKDKTKENDKEKEKLKGKNNDKKNNKSAPETKSDCQGKKGKGKKGKKGASDDTETTSTANTQNTDDAGWGGSEEKTSSPKKSEQESSQNDWNNDQDWGAQATQSTESDKPANDTQDDWGGSNDPGNGDDTPAADAAPANAAAASDWGADW